MVLGMSLATFTPLHVVISLIAIATGLVVAAGMLAGNRLPGWTAVFLVTTVLTTATGFLFPFTQLLPSHIVGAISLVVLPLALVALYGKGLAGSWRGVYVIGSIFALYLNVFVLVVQAFLKIPPLNRSRRRGPSRRSRSPRSSSWPSSSGWAFGPCGASIRWRRGPPSALAGRGDLEVAPPARPSASSRKRPDPAIAYPLGRRRVRLHPFRQRGRSEGGPRAVPSQLPS